MIKYKKNLKLFNFLKSQILVDYKSILYPKIM